MKTFLKLLQLVFEFLVWVSMFLCCILLAIQWITRDMVKINWFWMTYLILVLSFIGVVGLAIEWVFKWSLYNWNENFKKTQKRNIVFGDQAGRDINKG